MACFAPICDQPRRTEHDTELQGLLERYETVACDLSETTAIGTPWLRWFNRMTLKAAPMGKRWVVVGMRDTVRETADAVGLEDGLVLVPTLEEAWES